MCIYEGVPRACEDLTCMCGASGWSGERVYTLSDTKRISETYYRGNEHDNRRYWRSAGKAGKDLSKMVFVVANKCEEHTFVSRVFLQTMRDVARIEKIERIENGFQRNAFIAQVENIHAQVVSARQNSLCVRLACIFVT